MAVAVAGVVLGLLWLWLAPRVPLYTDGKAVYLKDPEGEEAIGADAVFVLLGIGFGLLTGAAVFLVRRSGGVGVVVGLVAGALLGSVIAWRLGVWLGPDTDVAAAARAAGKGATFDGPLKLQAKGALLAWPLAAVALHLVMTVVVWLKEAGSAPPPVQQGWATPDGDRGSPGPS
nr:ABC transporter permease [Streptomyces boncukensis]